MPYIVACPQSKDLIGRRLQSKGTGHFSRTKKALRKPDIRTAPYRSRRSRSGISAVEDQAMSCFFGVALEEHPESRAKCVW